MVNGFLTEGDNSVFSYMQLVLVNHPCFYMGGFIYSCGKVDILISLFSRVAHDG